MQQVEAVYELCYITIQDTSSKLVFSLLNGRTSNVTGALTGIKSMKKNIVL